MEEFDQRSKFQLRGIGASPGKAVGRVKWVKNLTDMETVDGSTVILLKEPWPGVALGLLRASGLIVEVGNRVCHTAVIAFEMGKPCVVGVSRATELLQDGLVVELDGSEGTIDEQ